MRPGDGPGSSAILWSDTAGSDASVVMASWRMASRVSHLQLCTVAGTHMRCGVPRIDASVLRYLNSPQQGYIAYLLAVAILAAVHAHSTPINRGNNRGTPFLIEGSAFFGVAPRSKHRSTLELMPPSENPQPEPLVELRGDRLRLCFRRREEPF